MVELLVSDSETTALPLASGKKNVEPSLLIPWSCRESFTAHVCGLPSAGKGCSRHRDTPDVEPGERKGISPLGKHPPDSVAAWVVFEYDASYLTDLFSVKIYEGNPVYRTGWHQAFFGFDAAGVEALKEGRNHHPVYLKFLAYNKARAAHQEVTGWLSSEGDIGLSACFGRNTFVSLTPKQEWGCQIHCARGVSIADLIDAYLDTQPSQCSFRAGSEGVQDDPQRRNLGITTCKVEVALSKRNFKERSESYLNSCDIAFSLVDPDTLTIKRVEGGHLGVLDGDIAPGIRDLDERYFQPLYVANHPERRGEMNYARCLSRDGRGQILPTEVGNSFLTFTAGEMCSYLLHWFLLRIFAHGQHPNEAFAQKFQEWLNAAGDRHRSRALFRELLQTPVLLPADTTVFKEEVKALAGRGKYLGIYDEPTPFGEVLSTLGLGTPNDAWIQQTADFLLRYHTQEKTSDQNLRSLPMFEALSWSDDLLLRERGRATSDVWGDLEAIVHYLASSFQGRIPDAEKARSDAAKLTGSCVFPIAEALPHLASSLGLPLYYIFPLWEDTVRQWHGPVIFAHVFTKAMPFDSDVPPDQDRRVLDMGTELQNLLVPIVSAIAHANYNAAAKKHERIQREAEEQKRLAVAAYKLGHPLKDRVGPLRAVLNTLKRELSGLPGATHLREEVNNAGDLLTRISQLGHILDITSVAMMGNKGSAAFLKEGKENDWRAADSYDLRTQIPKLSRLSKDPRAAREVVLLEEDLSRLGEAHIEPWIEDHQGCLWRPGNLFYDEVISEVLTNAAKYGKRVRDRVTLRLEIEEIGGALYLLVSNECQTTPNAAKLGLPWNEWRPWNTGEDGSIGGLFYIANSLEQTISGAVYAKLAVEGDGCRFVVGLQLKGLVAGASANK